MDDWFDIFITVAVYLILATVIMLVLTGIWYFTDSLRRPWLQLQRIRKVSWNGLDVIVVFLIALTIPFLVEKTLDEAEFFGWLYGPAENQASLEAKRLWTSALAWPLALGLSVLGLRQFRRARLVEMKLTSKGAAKNFAIGCCAWAILTPLTLAAFELSLLSTPADLVEQHPAIEAGRRIMTSADWIMWLLVIIVVASLGEEIIFRGILLPWQLRRGWEAQATIAMFTLLVAVLMGSRNEGRWYNPMPVVFVLLTLSFVFLVPLLRKRRTTPTEVGSASPQRVENGNQLRIPIDLPNTTNDRSNISLAICTNALLFATMHAQVWPSPIPLFILGIGLAWISYRTSNLIGCVTLHALFNAVSALSLFWEELLKLNQ